MKKQKVIAIVGPTASGKTALSIALAQHFGSEVISADSRQVYHGMDLGTGKVTPKEMAGVPHHLIDIADPITDTYTGSDFIRDAKAAITDITGRGNLPIIAGGTFFYIELLRGTMQPAPVAPNKQLRTELETKSNLELFALLQAADPERAATIDQDNPRRLIRALEIIDALGVVPPVIPTESDYRWLTIGIDIPTDILNARIYERIMTRLDTGMIEEVDALQKNGVSWERLEDFGLEYRYIARFLRDQITRDIMIQELAAKTRQFAKRQRLWLKRDPGIVWLPFPVDSSIAIHTVQDFISPKTRNEQ